MQNTKDDSFVYDVVRVRVAVARCGGGKDGLVHVLNHFTQEERAVLEGEVFGKVKRAVEGIAAGEVARMYAYNGKPNRACNAKEVSNAIADGLF